MRTVLLLVVLAGSCAAQGITPTAQDFGRGGQPSRATYSFGLEADVIDKDDAVRWQRGDAQVNAPLLLGEKFKLFAFAGVPVFDGCQQAGARLSIHPVSVAEFHVPASRRS